MLKLNQGQSEPLNHFQHLSIAVFKIFMCGHSYMMTFLHLKVQYHCCKFSIGSVSPSSWVQFQHAKVAMLKTFMHGHSCMMNFLHLKVHDGQCIFFIGSVSPSPLCPWFSFNIQVWYWYMKTWNVQSLAWLYLFAEAEYAKKWIKMVRFCCVGIGMAFQGLGNLQNRPRNAIHNFYYKFTANDKYMRLVNLATDSFITVLVPVLDIFLDL